MKIFFLIDTLNRGGKERRCVQLIKGLNQMGINDIHIILFDNMIEYDEVFELSVTIHSLDRAVPKDIKVFSKIYKLLKLHKPDIVFSWSLMSSFYLNFIRIIRKFNYISGYVADTLKPPLLSLVNISRLLSFVLSSYIVGNSKLGLQVYNVPKKKRVLIYNGFDLSRLNNLIQPYEIRTKYNIRTKYIVCMVATVNKAKDYQTYINAAKQIIKQRNDVTFLAIGSGPLLNYYQSQINKEESEFIIFTGNISDVESVINICDVSVLTSFSEGISNAILESMMLGKPVLATDSGGTSEIVCDDLTGYLLKLEDALDLTAKLNHLLDNSDLRITMGINAKRIAGEKFSLEKMCKSYYDLFVKVMNMNKG